MTPRITRPCDVYDERFIDGTAVEVWLTSPHGDQPYILGVCAGSCATRVAPVEGAVWPEEHESWAAALAWLIAGEAERHEREWRA